MIADMLLRYHLPMLAYRQHAADSSTLGAEASGEHKPKHAKERVVLGQGQEGTMLTAVSSMQKQI